MSFFFKGPSDQQSNKPYSNVGSKQSNNPPIQPPFNETGTVIGINGKFLHGVLCGVVAWWCWPTDPKWWGFGMFSVILWAASMAFVFEGIRSFIKLRGAKKRWRVIEKMGSSPKNARIPEKSDLQEKGMN